MPSSARKSSLGGAARRAIQKAHIPYRGDNPEVGKKTGITVQHVERKSDGFEPFEELLQQAPSPPRKKKKSIAAVNRRNDDYYDDDDGEQSMQLDSPDYRQLVNIRPPSTPTTAPNRSIRPVARTSDVDFDQIPSPRPLSSHHRTARSAGAGPSNLRHSIREPSLSASESDNDPVGDYNYEDNDNDFNDQQSPDNSRTPRQSSYGDFSRIEEEDEDEEEEEEEREPTPRQDTPPRAPSPQQYSPDSRRKKKRAPSPVGSPPHQKNKATLPMEESPDARQNNKSKRKVDRGQSGNEEDDIAQGLQDVEMGPGSATESEPEVEPPTKKTKVVKERKLSKTQSRSKKENREYREGIRRSKREHIPPLEWWRGEKMVYGRTNSSGPVYVAPIKEIVRIPKEPVEPLGAAKRSRGSTRARSRSRPAADPNGYDIPPALPVVNPEEGWDDNTQSLCTVIQYTTKEEVERRIAWTARMVEPRLASNHSWSFDKIFGDDDFIAAGQLVIPPRGRKPSKAAKDNTYIFYVVEGAVNFKIHQTSMILATGGMFMVPRGNTYLIENICERDAKLFFTQARKVMMNDEERAARRDHAAETHRRRSMLRSSSTGANLGGGASSTDINGRAASLAALTSTIR